MLKLIDLIHLSGIDLGDYKIHCATDNKYSGWQPLDQYYAGKFEQGQSEQSHKHFECDHVLSLINLGNSKRWLFVGVYQVNGVQPAKGGSGFIYSLKRLPGLQHLDGRVIVDFPKSFRASYLIGTTHEDQLIVNSIQEEPLSIADFPGFNGIRLSFEMLVSIIRQNNTSWRTALANIAGVYVIADRLTGKQYVGSAYGGVGVWNRWSQYAKTGHGSTKELQQLLKQQGVAYAKNLQFSLVEMCDINASDDYIRDREAHWKEVLLTREFGLNAN